MASPRGEQTIAAATIGTHCDSRVCADAAIRKYRRFDATRATITRDAGRLLSPIATALRPPAMQSLREDNSWWRGGALQPR